MAADAGDAQAPAQAKWAIAVTGAVDQSELGLDTVAARGQHNRHGEVAGASMQIGRELLADTLHRAAALGKRDDLFRGA